MVLDRAGEPPELYPSVQTGTGAGADPRVPAAGSTELQPVRLAGTAPQQDAAHPAQIGDRRERHGLRRALGVDLPHVPDR
jgi:hypothetical protein